MKKIVILLLALMMLLTACGRNDDSSQQSSAAPHGQTGSGSQTASETSVGISNWNKLRMNWNGKLGVYSAIEPKALASGGKASMVGTSSNYFLLTFFDYDKLDGTVLCNKPNCKHDSGTCNAYFPINGTSRNESVLFEMNDKIYIIAKGTVYAMNEDGTNRSKILQLPSKYTAQSTKMTAFLIRDNVYLETDYLTDVKVDRNGNLPADDNGRRTALFMLDIGAKTYKELYEYKALESSEWLGIIGSKAYYLYQDDFTKLQHHTQEEVNAQYNGRNTKIFARDLGSGNRTDLFSGKSDEYDQVILRGSALFYQNRKTGEIIRYNPESGEKKALVSNLKTYIKFLSMDIQNNKLFYTVDYYDADLYHKEPTDNETCYVDIDSGKATKIGYRISRDDGKTDTFSGFTKETGDYYILPLKYEMGTVSGGSGYVGYDYVKATHYGKIKKQDFWNGKYDVQQISWEGDGSLLK